jgi:prepilin-type processing-associated H-X9-DG protein
MLRQLAIGQLTYSDDFQGYIAGPSTSGLSAQYTNNAAEYCFDTSESTPTTTQDWISPTVGTSFSLSPNRAQRLFQIHEELACAAATHDAVLFNNTPTPADRPDFDDLLLRRRLRQISYMAPSGFHYFPDRDAALRREVDGVIPWYSFSTPVQVHPQYMPRLDKVGFLPAAKVVAADGTRFFPDSGIDVQINTNPTPAGGSFLDSGPIFDASRAYGRSVSSYPTNTELSFRHGGSNTMNAAFFDGHVRIIKSAEAHADASLWYPGGSTFTGGNATPEASRRWQPDDEVP